MTYSVAANAVAGTSGAFSSARANLSDIDGCAIPVTFAAGGLTVASVPEPRSLLSSAIGLLACGT